MITALKKAGFSIKKSTLSNAHSVDAGRKIIGTICIKHKTYKVDFIIVLVQEKNTNTQSEKNLIKASERFKKLCSTNGFREVY